jgi:MoCo/4Fe-4S cofactor protein with predicted Tat translocation signal
MNRKNLKLELSAFVDRLPSGRGKRFWRSLEELAETEEFQRMVAREFPEQGVVWSDRFSRRDFLTLMGASLALAGLSGCSVRPASPVDSVPYVRPPEDAVPGWPLFFATAMSFAGSAVGLLVESNAGRPTKVEGNPDHPASRGGTGTFQQASILTLYDPDRAQTVTNLGRTRTWDAFRTTLHEALQKQRSRRGAGLRLLTETIDSPTLAGQIEILLKDCPEAKWHVYEPIHSDMADAGSHMAFGEIVRAVYDFTKADVVLALDADFLQYGPGNIRYAADFSARRRVRTSLENAHAAEMNRLYVIETAVSCTGAKADHRLALRSIDIETAARAIASRLGVADAASVSAGQLKSGDDTAIEKWIAAVAKDLDAHHGRSLVIAGERQPPVVHLLAHVLNNRLGNVGQTMRYIAPPDFRPGDRRQSLRELVDDMQKNRVEVLLILGANPVYASPADIDFLEPLKKVPLRIQHSLFLDETACQCHWHLPAAHFLEAWGDAQAYDGTASIVQPLIEPLYQGRSACEVLSLFVGDAAVPGREIVRAEWQNRWKELHRDATHAGKTFEEFWQQTLHDGVVAGSAFAAKSMKLKDGWQSHLKSAGEKPASPAATGRSAELAERLEIDFQPDPTIHDGSWANNGWLQELPKPITKLAWGNAAIMSPATARQIGIAPGSYAHGGEHGGYSMPVLELRLDGRDVRAPAWIMPGHADGSVTVYLGHGRNRAGRIGGSPEHSVGFNAYLLRTAAQPWFATGLELKKLDEIELVACTQAHQLMENRHLVRSGSLEDYGKDPRFATKPDREREQELAAQALPPLTLYESQDYAPPKHKWGMVIDLTACIGCSACMVACQAENNIPVVGKEQVARGREMHWLRVDRYFSAQNAAGGPGDSPAEFHHQPVPCMHCENAPCEYVCPVEATVHSSEGLNDMVYNRCVGTRFCSNNCPYKVRRFNFLAFADFDTPSRRLQYNPEVTVRSRGVMEKCTYCVQRIRRAEIDGETQQRPLRDGEVVTACQAACPTGAIVFGDMNDPQSQVKQDKDSPLHYGLLTDLNTLPRTTYLAELRNPNPELENLEHGDQRV